MPVALALASSALWGVSDYLGGAVSRRLRPLAVVGWSQLVALLAVLAWVTTTDAWRGGPWLLPALVAGALGPLGLGAFYAGLGTGRMGVVAPLASLGVLVPVGVGLVVRGEAPDSLQALGMVVAVTGAVLVGGPEVRTRVGARPVILALVAAGCFGAVQALIATGGRSSVPMTLLGMRVVTVGGLGLLALARRDAGGLARRDAAPVATVGLFDLGGNVTFAVAAVDGSLSITAVLGSLYPVVTTLLARARLGERLGGLQIAGVVAAVAGAGLVSGG